MRLHENPKTVVLVVDDSVDSIRMINDALENAGMTVLVALDGSQAVNISHNITPDIVLLDALMPNMDGFETCRLLKEKAGFADIPIIFMTGLSDTEHVVMGLSSGGVDYVTKPINTTELLARMQVHLTNARITRSARQALDATGQNLFATNRRGELLWSTPEVSNTLPDPTQPAGQLLQEQLRTWFGHGPETGHAIPLPGVEPTRSIEFLALVDDREYLMRLRASENPNQATAALRKRFDLTVRESDVLLWIANGKTNREIGQILEMSPRTVNKHLEQVFRKVGVENRTAAAASAIRLLAGQA